MSENNTFEKSKTEHDWSLYNKDGGYNSSLEQKRLSGCADFTFPFSPQTPSLVVKCARRLIQGQLFTTLFLQILPGNKMAAYFQRYSDVISSGEHMLLSQNSYEHNNIKKFAEMGGR